MADKTRKEIVEEYHMIKYIVTMQADMGLKQLDSVNLLAEL